MELLELLHYTKTKDIENVKSETLLGNIGDMANSMKNKVDVLGVLKNNNVN